MISFYIIKIARMFCRRCWRRRLRWSQVMQGQVQALGVRGYRHTTCKNLLIRWLTGWIAKSKYFWLCIYRARCKPEALSAMLSCCQALIGSLTGFSYLSSSWIVAGVVPGHTRIHASGAVVGDRSRRFVFLLVRFLGPCLVAPLIGSATWPRPGR